MNFSLCFIKITFLLMKNVNSREQKLKIGKRIEWNGQNLRPLTIMPDVGKDVEQLRMIIF